MRRGETHQRAQLSPQGVGLLRRAGGRLSQLLQLLPFGGGDRRRCLLDRSLLRRSLCRRRGGSSGGGGCLVVARGQLGGERIARRLCLLEPRRQRRRVLAELDRGGVPLGPQLRGLSLRGGRALLGPAAAATAGALSAAQLGEPDLGQLQARVGVGQLPSERLVGVQLSPQPLAGLVQLLLQLRAQLPAGQQRRGCSVIQVDSFGGQ